MNFTHIIALDPGKHGAWVKLDMSGIVVDKSPIPLIDEEYDCRQLIDDLTFHADGLTLVYLEKVGGMPNDGGSRAFKFGATFGMLKAIIVCCGFPRIEVPPMTWQKEIHKEYPGSKKDKAKIKSLYMFNRIFYDIGNTHKKPHSGIMDAALIAEYGRRRIMAGADEWQIKWR